MSGVGSGHLKLTTEVRDRYLEILARSGVRWIAARVVGISPNAVLNLRKKDKEFDELCKEALLVYADSLEQEADRRARAGVPRNVYYQGEVCGTEMVYSDELLKMLLKRHIPEYRDHLTANVNVTGGVLAVVAPIASSGDWLSQYKEAKSAVEADWKAEEGNGDHRLEPPA